MQTLRILFDGRPLITAPLSPPAVHLFHLLSGLPAEIDPLLALPGDPPAWLPEGVQVLRSEDSGSLRWEQRSLPALAAKNSAAALHMMGHTGPLFSRVAALLNGAGYPSDDSYPTLAERLRAALGRGGATRSLGIIRPAWGGSSDANRTALPFRVPAAFKAKEFFYPPQIEGIPDLPATFFLFHGPQDRTTWMRTLEAWTWAAGPIGEVYPLALLGVPRDEWSWVQSRIERFGLDETVLLLPEISPADLPVLYRAASAVLQPAEASHWAGALQFGIACGKPVVGLEYPLAGRAAGKAAYLVEPGDGRKLGAALIAVVVKEHLARQLREAAAGQSENWRTAPAGEDLAYLYHSLLQGP